MKKSSPNSARKHRIRKLSFFGSVLGDQFGPGSDVDILVEFEPGATVGLIRMAGMEMELRSRYEITVASQTILLRLLMPFLLDG